MPAVRNAIIIGGGIAGPVAAVALARAGIEATIYEAYDRTADDVGAVLSLAPNGLDALRAVGIDGSPLGEPIDDMVIASASGRPIVTLPRLHGLPPSRVLWRSELYRALQAHVAQLGIRVVHGKRLVSMAETPEAIVAHFADGDWVSADILVGADGIRSTVRTLIDPTAPGPRYVGHIGFGGIAVGSGFRGAPRTMYFANGHRAFMGYWMQPDDTVLWFANLPRSTPLTSAQARQTSNAEWLRLLRNVFAGDVPGAQLVEHTNADTLLVAGAGEIMPSVPRWHGGRAVLVGDAAHAPSSSSGQGASLAAESAVELARCLRDCADYSSAFRAYEDLRRSRVSRIAAFGARSNNNKVAGPIARAIMSVVMPLAMKTVFKPEKMFGWMHGHHIDWQARVARA